MVDSNKQKSKEGLSNLLLLIGAVLIIMGIIIGFKGLFGGAFILCFMGTICTFTSTYLKHGYFKFFN